MIITVVGLAFEARIAARTGARVVCGGDGRTLAAALDRAIAMGCHGLVSFGVAGGLSPELRPGACVVASAILCGATRFKTDEIWSRNLLRAISGAVHGMVIGVSTPVAHAHAKRRLFLDTGAVAVDMESHIAASAASAHDLPMVAVRVVTDPAMRTLPKSALAGMRPNGTISVPAIINSVMRHPGELPALLRIARDALAGRGALLRGSRSLGACSGPPDSRTHRSGLNEQVPRDR